MKGEKQRIIVAWDGSAAGATALPVARKLGSQLGLEVAALYVDPAAATGPAASQRPAKVEELTGIELTLRTGDPASEILAATEEADVAFIVLTTHGRLIESPGRLGHVAEEVTAKTQRPLILVRPEIAASQPARALKRLLLPLDGAPKTARALRPATKLAAKLGASIDLLHVAATNAKVSSEPGSIVAPRYVDQSHHEWAHWSREVIARLASCCADCPPGLEMRMFLSQGDVGQEITRFAAKHAIDAIVLVRRSRLEMGRARALRAILASTPCPVLLVGGPGA